MKRYVTLVTLLLFASSRLSAQEVTHVPEREPKVFAEFSLAPVFIGVSLHKKVSSKVLIGLDMKTFFPVPIIYNMVAGDVRFYPLDYVYSRPKGIGLNPLVRSGVVLSYAPFESVVALHPFIGAGLEVNYKKLFLRPSVVISSPFVIHRETDKKSFGDDFKESTLLNSIFFSTIGFKF